MDKLRILAIAAWAVSAIGIALGIYGIVINSTKKTPHFNAGDGLVS